MKPFINPVEINEFINLWFMNIFLVKLIQNFDNHLHPC